MTEAELLALTKREAPRMELEWKGLFGYLGLFRVAELLEPVGSSIAWWWRAEVPRFEGPTRTGCGMSKAHAKQQVEEYLAWSAANE